MDSQVEEVKLKNDIADIVGDFITLKKAGRNYKANCPFHNEKTPSFVVSQELQIYKCFGCGESGDVISFLQKYEGMEFYEALQYLADRAGIKLKPFKDDQMGEKDRLFKINEWITQFYHYMLLKHPAGKNALDYTTATRKLTLQTIKEFRIGYCPDVPLAVKKFVVDKKKVSLKELEKAGLTYTYSGKVYDRFRGRIIFPLADHRGNIVGFAGRILPGKNTDLAKYINTPETAIYHKSKILYGLDLSKQEIKKTKTAVIVEGELDMVSCWQAGIKNVVAIKGSALTADQTALLKRFADTVVLALDTDIAGDKAARRGIEITEQSGLEVKVAVIEGYKDPDEAAKDNPQKLKDCLERAVGVWDFLLDSVFNRYSKNGNFDQTAKISKEVVPVLTSIKDSIVQAHYANLVAKRLHVPLEAVESQINKGVKETVIVVPETKSLDHKNRRQLLEERFVALAFQNNPEILDDPEIIQLITTTYAKKIAEKYLQFKKTGSNYSAKEFSANLPAELIAGFQNMVLNEDKEETPSESIQEIVTVKHELRILDIKTRLKQAGEDVQTFENGHNKKELAKAKKRFGALTRQLQEMELTVKPQHFNA